MNCVGCKEKSCRSTMPCPVSGSADPEIIKEYLRPENQSVVQAAALLVDNGRAGTLSRIEEIAEFASAMKYASVGMAYCYGLEREAATACSWLRGRGIKVNAVSCTAGSLPQSSVNSESDLSGVSCNPLSQAEALNKENVPFAVTFGLCLGHDILFNRYFRGDVTSLIVKDRTSNHNPLLAINNLTG